MQYIPYDPKSDPWYQFGNLLGNGLSLLAYNRDARQAGRIQEEEARKSDLEKENQYRGLVQQYGELSKDPEKNKEQLGLLINQLGRNFYGRTLPTVDNYNQILENTSKNIDYLNKFNDANKGLFFNDDNYTHYDTSYKKGLLL